MASVTVGAFLSELVSLTLIASVVDHLARPMTSARPRSKPAARATAQSDTDPNISYYGVGLDNLLGDLAKVTKPLIVHIADKDEFFPPEGRAKVVEAVRGHKQIAAYVYPDADHAFARVGGVHWDGRAAAIANGRSAEALVAALG
jgi:carboxymethylenebutenolidase